MKHRGVHHYLDGHQSSLRLCCIWLLLSASLSSLTLSSVSGQCEQTERLTGGGGGGKKTKSEEDVMEKNHTGLHFLLHWLYFFIDEADIPLSNGACGELAKKKSTT